jgi:transcriptional regulator with XRE-family HTH domain
VTEPTLRDATGTPDPDTTLVVGLGKSLKAARVERGLTVERLAREAGVSTGLISQLERGLGNPSFLTLQRLAETLELPFGYFMQGPQPQGGMVVRAAERKRLVVPHNPTEIVHELLTPDLRGSLEVLRTSVPAGWSNEAQPFHHPGEECVHVLSGALHVTVGASTFDLEEGDSITYDSATSHWYANRSDQSVTIIGAVTPPSF